MVRRWAAKEHGVDRQKRRNALLIAVAATVIIVAMGLEANRKKPPPAEPVAVVPPTSLSGRAVAGRILFTEHCAQCHGAMAGGTDQGPPLVHPYYAPGHHADAAFHQAVRVGVTAHHWHFGDMPPQPGVSPDDVGKILAYVRAVQAANGVE